MVNQFKVADSDSAIRPGLDSSALQRELVYTAFNDTMRKTGVPPAFIDCEFISYVDDQNVTQVQIRLILKKWSGMMLRYSMAFQRQMCACLDRFEPHVDHTAYGWFWQYAKGCDEPFPSMPAPEEWIKKTEAALVPHMASKLEFFERRKIPREPKQRIIIR